MVFVAEKQCVTGLERSATETGLGQRTFRGKMTQT